MSEQNVDLVRRIYYLWAREESARDLLAEDVEYVNPSYAVEPGTRRGRRSFAVVRDTYKDFGALPLVPIAPRSTRRGRIVIAA